MTVGMRSLGKTRRIYYVLREYLAHGDNVLYANLIHITRQVFLSSDLDLDRLYEILYVLSNILPAISRFDIQNTIP